jgi:cytochrome c biogenesis protein CcmG/thiol:disulfide interchange protein DsbE
MDNGRWICIALATMLLAACSPAPSIARVGAQAPSWMEPRLTGSSLSLEQLRGKAVYLNFFATWCPPCNAEAPAIDGLYRRYAARGLQVVGVDVLESAPKAASFARAHGVTYPVVVDDGTMRDRYRVNALPVHVFIDRHGVVRQIVDGEMDASQMRAAIERVLR